MYEYTNEATDVFILILTLQSTCVLKKNHTEAPQVYIIFCIHLKNKFKVKEFL